MNLIIKEYLKSIRAEVNVTVPKSRECAALKEELTSYCSFKNNCDKRAICIYDKVRRSYSCRCPEGFVGNGFKCYGKKAECISFEDWFDLKIKFCV